MLDNVKERISVTATIVEPKGGVLRTKKRVLTRRGVLWLGQTCNQRCYFCYFLNKISNEEHPEHAFMSIEKAKTICKTLVDFYHNTSIDIQGGEPTIYREILELCQYCHDIGLYPTLITNGIALSQEGKLEQYRDHGLRDFLVSLHGIGKVHDQVVGAPGAYGCITKALEGMAKLGIQRRINCTMSKPVVPLLPEIAQKSIEYGALAVNYIAFNPFEDQKAGIRTHENVPKYSDLRGPLTEALDMLEAAGIEANVRYVPLCMAEPRHRKSFYNFQQLPYDTHEWDYESWMWTMMYPQRMRDGGLNPAYRIGVGSSRLYRSDCFMRRDAYQMNPLKGRIKYGTQHVLARLEAAVRGRDVLYREEAKLRASVDCGYKYHDGCNGCAARNICDGFHGDYADLFGTAEAKPITGMPPVDDPLHFIREQDKVVEVEDQAWAM